MHDDFYAYVEKKKGKTSLYTLLTPNPEQESGELPSKRKLGFFSQSTVTTPEARRITAERQPSLNALETDQLSCIKRLPKQELVTGYLVKHFPGLVEQSELLAGPQDTGLDLFSDEVSNRRRFVSESTLTGDETGSTAGHTGKDNVDSAREITINTRQDPPIVNFNLSTPYDVMMNNMAEQNRLRGMSLFDCLLYVADEERKKEQIKEQIRREHDYCQ